MSASIDDKTVRQWIDDDLVESVERIPDDVAEFNFLVDMSNILVHVLRRDPNGPVLIGQEIEYDEGIQTRIQDLSDGNRNAVFARIREVLADVPVVYGIRDGGGNNARFREMETLFVEYRIYPDELTQHALMTGLVAVWNAMRYVDDVENLIDAVTR